MMNYRKVSSLPDQFCASRLKHPFGVPQALLHACVMFVPRVDELRVFTEEELVEKALEALEVEIFSPGTDTDGKNRKSFRKTFAEFFCVGMLTGD